MNDTKEKQLDIHCGFKWSSANGIFSYLNLGFIRIQDFDLNWQEQGCKDAFRFGVNALRIQLQLRLRAMEGRQKAETLTLHPDDIGYLVCILCMNGWEIYHLVAGQPSTSAEKPSRLCLWNVDCTMVCEGKNVVTFLIENMCQVHYWD